MEYQYQAWQAAATAVLNVVAVLVVVVVAVVEAVINPYFFAVVSVNKQADNAHFYFSILFMWTHHLEMSQHYLLCRAWSACPKPGEVTPTRFKTSKRPILSPHEDNWRSLSWHGPQFAGGAHLHTRDNELSPGPFPFHAFLLCPPFLWQTARNAQPCLMRELILAQTNYH